MTGVQTCLLQDGSQTLYCPIGRGCRIQWQLFCRGVRSHPYECPGHDTKLSDGEASVMLELWGMQNTPSLSSLPGSLRPRVVAPDRVLSMDQIELNCVLLLKIELLLK